ncbi:MAG: Sb-PDE family phosphodiesterase [Verrucomicrobiota bacterium]
MQSRSVWLAAVAALLTQGLFAHEPITRARTPVNIPDVPGYVTLKCDFHIHTVFSDGLVWPSVRSEEAWRQGLDAIAITDHIEYQPHKADVSTNHNRSYQIARKTGDDLDLLVIKGSEITHKMPPGHINAIFLTNSLPLATTNWQDQTRIAHEQGAFIFWNHPGWDAQLKDGKTVWYDEHSWLLEKGFLQGIEVVNGRDYYPEAHRWAIEKKLTMLSNSDIHSPLNLDYNINEENDHRPITLVFAKERTREAIKDALFARRTAVYSGDKLVGEEQFLKPIFTQAVKFVKDSVKLTSKDKYFLQLANSSDLTYELERVGDPADVSTLKSLRLAANKTVLFEVKTKANAANGPKQIAATYQVKNLLVAPDEPLKVTLTFEATIALESKN